jgi:hypothetical protein
VLDFAASVWAERVRERGRIQLDSAPLPDPPPHELADTKQWYTSIYCGKFMGGGSEPITKIRAPQHNGATSKLQNWRFTLQ